MKHTRAVVSLLCVIWLVIFFSFSLLCILYLLAVNKLEYIKFMLVAMKKIDADLFDDLHEQFNDVSKDVHNIVLWFDGFLIFFITHS